MKKSLEVGFFVALSVMTVMATTSVLQVNSVQHSALAQWFDKTVRSIVGRGQEPAPVTKMEPRSEETSDVQPEAKPVGPTTSQTSWSSDDFDRLTQIAEQVMGSLTPDEWKTASSAILAPDGKDDAQRLASIVQRHISPTDVAWLKSQFGNHPTFSENDLQLLHNTFTEFESELTPDEQSLLKDQMNQWMTGKTTSTTGK